MNWKPISSAPKTGESILLIDICATELEACVGAWHDLGEGVSSTLKAGYWRVGCPWGQETSFPEPTHWMELAKWPTSPPTPYQWVECKDLPNRGGEQCTGWE